MQTLPQSVGADDQVVERQGQFDNGVPANVTALARRHLFAEHATVAAAEEVDQAVVGNGVSAESGGAVEGVALAFEQVLQSSQGLAIIGFGGAEG